MKVPAPVYKLHIRNSTQKNTNHWEAKLKRLWPFFVNASTAKSPLDVYVWLEYWEF